MVAAGRRLLLGTATDTASGAIVDVNGRKHQVNIPGSASPGLRHQLARQAAKTGLAAIIDSRSSLEQGQHAATTTAAEHEPIPLLLSPGPYRGPLGDTTALSALQVPVDLLHRRMGHVNSQKLRILRVFDDNGIN